MKSVAKYLVVAGGVFLSSAAYGQFSYSGSAELYSTNVLQATGQPDVVDLYSPPNNSRAGIFRPNVQTFQRSFNVNTSAYPSFTSAHDDMSVTTQASPTLFSYAWAASQTGGIVPPASDITAFNEDALDFAGTLRVTMTQDVTVRISWHALASGIVGGNSGDETHPSHYAFNSLSGTGISSPFTFGYGRAADVQSDFSFETNVLTGQVITLQNQIQLYLSNVAFPNTPTWNQSTSGSFSIAVVPAPSAAAVLGLGALTACRRRRR